MSSLGDVWVNWKNLTMRFEVEGSRVTLQGDPSLVKSMVSLKVMVKSVCQSGKGYFVEFSSIEYKTEQIINPLNPRVATLLEEYKSLFEQPHHLPPKRSHDHAITLQTDAKPPNIRPYRYLMCRFTHTHK